MSKVGVVVLIIAALVFCGLGFVIGQIVQYSGSNIGTEADPVVTQAYVDKLVGERVTALQAEIESLQADLAALQNGGSSGVSTNNPPAGGNDDNNQYVKTTTSVNIRSAASTSGDILKTVDSNTEMVYLGSANSSDGVWYNVRLSDGTEGYVASWYCTALD